MILEGSALWPDLAATRSFDGLAALWLTASDDIFRRRIHRESRYHSRSAIERLMVDKFLDRTLAYNKQMIDVVNRHGLRLVDVLQSGVADRVSPAIPQSPFRHGPLGISVVVQYRHVGDRWFAQCHPIRSRCRHAA